MVHSSGIKLAYVYSLIAILIGAAIFSRYNRVWRKVKITKNIQKESEVDYHATSCVYKVSHSNFSIAWMYHTVTINWEPSENCTTEIQDLIRIKDGSILRVQAYSNNELVTAAAVYSENNTYTANLLLSIPGKFVVIVMLIYVNGDNLEDKHHVKPILKQIQGSPYEVTVLPNTIPRGITRYCTKRESGQARGRWVKCGNVLGDLFPPLERCGPWQSDPNFNFDHIHGFRWLPYRCQLHHYSNDDMKRCLAKSRWRSLVFAGDSHMRYRAYHWVTRLYGACHSCAKTHIKMVFNKIPRIEWIFDARGTRLPLTYGNISLPYEKYMHPKVRRSKFSTQFPGDAMESDLFIMNFGHWALRESTDYEFMTKKLAAYTESMVYLMRSGKQVIWVNTVSLPWRSDQAVIDWKENTSPSRVRQFNDLADRYMKANGIQIVDAFQISDGRISATHDQTHYAKRLPGNDFGGVVENAISNSIINSLCNPE
ncbi:uncharacterized protein LOC135694552 [Rhopilema esculentum]|uniref:uncharacterized protein LOC135694552 n=1 Tax=Rhopilema esculentum TaxID=499914 RepID=UPI0031CE5AC5|eukprot:gene4336-20545_t